MRSDWMTPPVDLQLTKNDVHVWRASLVASPLIRQHLRSVLLPEEVARAERYYFEKDRLQWTVARGVMRVLLGRYLHVDPRQLRFEQNAYGRPMLASPWCDSGLHFNISHSHELALYAFTYDREIGVDVEYMRTDIEYQELAKHSFSPHENEVLQSLPQETWNEAFFNCWTRKEAYIKARGMGLSLALDLFDVSLKPGEPAALLGSRESPQELTRWQFHILAPGEKYAGALAAEGNEWQLRCWQWSL